jgi:tRNA (guanine-N7-)-methyltransferase
LEKYRHILKPGGWLRLKTDNDLLFAYTLETLKTYPGVSDLAYTYDLYHSPYLEEHFGIKTRYEKKFTEEGLSIKYLKCRLMP